MTYDIQATGFLGVAFEATAGTYVAPTKYFPIKSENLKFSQATQWRRLIRGIADEIGAVAGNSMIEGDITMEALSDAVPYFLHASRNTVVKTGTGPYTYTCTPFHGAIPTSTRTMSITVARDGLAFGYTGCVVGSMKFEVGDDGILMFTAHVMGRDESSQTLPSATFSTVTPFGHGSYVVEIPDTTTVLDVSTFSFEVNDNTAAVHRLSSVRTPQYIRFGERSVNCSFTRDFTSRTEYDAFKSLTAQIIQLTAGSSPSQIQITMSNAIKEDYTIGGLENQGDLVTAQFNVKGEYSTSTSKAYEIIVIANTENIA